MLVALPVCRWRLVPWESATVLAEAYMGHPPAGTHEAAVLEKATAPWRVDSWAANDSRLRPDGARNSLKVRIQRQCRRS